MATQGNREIDEKELRGVRKRAWGRWVSEIRVPHNRSRIWLGSYDDPVKAARAYDAALLCIYGPSTKKEFNFPEECRYWPRIPEHQRRLLSKTQIKSIAMRYVFHVDAATDPSPPASFVGAAASLPAPASIPAPHALAASTLLFLPSIFPVGTSISLPCITFGVPLITTALLEVAITSGVAVSSASFVPPPLAFPTDMMTSTEIASLDDVMMTSAENYDDDYDELKGLSAETFLLKNANTMQEIFESWEKK